MNGVEAGLLVAISLLTSPRSHFRKDRDLDPSFPRPHGRPCGLGLRKTLISKDRLAGAPSHVGSMGGGYRATPPSQSRNGPSSDLAKFSCSMRTPRATRYEHAAKSGEICLNRLESVVHIRHIVTRFHEEVGRGRIASDDAMRRTLTLRYGSDDHPQHHGFSYRHGRKVS